MKSKNFAKPVNSHLVMFDKPRVSIVNGYVERVFGILISQHVDEYDAIVTNRTILCDEELNSTWNIHSNQGDSLEALHCFKSFPNITMDDVAIIVRQTCGTRGLHESFDNLKELGCIIPDIDEPLVMKVHENSETYSFRHKNIYVSGQSKWIPDSLEYLYSIQSFLNRRIVLETYKDTTISTDSLAMMNELLENQSKNLVFTDGIFSENKAYNDGVYTYYTNGVTIEMTREEFIKKFPGAYEVLG